MSDAQTIVPRIVIDRAANARFLILQAGDDAHWTRLLHIHIEDNNLDDYWFERGPDGMLIDEDIRDAYPKAEQWERDIFDALAACTEDERYFAVTGEPYPASAYQIGEDDSE